MADENPTGRGVAVTLKLPADHVCFLRETFKSVREGIRDELENAKRLRDPDRLRCEDAAYGRLLAALDELVVVPDNDVREMVASLAQNIDGGNEYERAVFEHEALHGLLNQIRGAGCR